MNLISLKSISFFSAKQAEIALVSDASVQAFRNAVFDLWYQIGLVLSEAVCLNWPLGNLRNNAADLSEEPPAKVTAPSDTTNCPCLWLQQTPDNDTRVLGIFLGRNSLGEIERLIQAVAKCVDSISPVWSEITAVLLRLPPPVRFVGELYATPDIAGHRICAVSSAARQADNTPPQTKQVTNPRAKLAASYNMTYGQHRVTYTSMPERSVT